MPNRPITRKEAEAWKFAKSAHKGQVRRFINQPYFEAHVKKVNAIVKQYTTDEDILCAAILHDVAEDCYTDVEVGLYEISDLFGKRVGNLVRELTSIREELEKGYDGDKAAYLSDKMIHMSDDALIIKLSDRLQNISDAFTANERFRNKYFEETWRIVDDIEKHRSFNRIHLLLLEGIKAKLNNIGTIFRIKRFDDFNESLSSHVEEIDEFMDIIKDKTLDLTDIGFRVEVEDENSEPLLENMIRITIEKSGLSKVFQFKECSYIVSDILLTNIEMNIYKNYHVIILPEWRENNQSESLSCVFVQGEEEARWSFDNYNKIKSFDPLNLSIKRVEIFFENLK